MQSFKDKLIIAVMIIGVLAVAFGLPALAVITSHRY
jgi:hypothetical protein